MAAFRTNALDFPNLAIKGSPDDSDLLLIGDAASSPAGEPKQSAIGTLPFVSLAGDTMTGPLILNADPVNPLGAATMQYVNSVAAGISPITGVVVASTVALTVTYANGAAGVGATLTNAGAQAAIAIDGVSLSLNDRVLIKDQASTFQNGIYQVTTVGSGASNWVLTRTTDYDTAAEILPGTLVPVEQGTVNNTTSWLQTETVTTVGTDPILFAQFTAGVGATRALDNLLTTAINQDLIGGSDGTQNLGTGTTRWGFGFIEELVTGTGAGDTLVLSARDVDGAAWVPFITLTANNTPTCSFSGAVTGVTQVLGTDTTQLATTEFVQDAIVELGDDKANRALDNLTATAINTSLVSDLDLEDDLGTMAIRWDNLFVSRVATGDTVADTLVLSARDVDGAAFVDFITLTAGNTPTGVLNGAMTSTTQAPGTNNTQLATTAFVQAAVTSGGSAGVVFLATATASNSSVINFANVFSATYDNYILLCENVVPATDGALLTLQVGTGAGPTYQTTNYLGSGCHWTTVGAGAISTLTTAHALSSNTNTPDNAGVNAGQYTVNFSGVNSSLNKPLTSIGTYIFSASNLAVGLVYTGTWQSTAVLTSFRLQMTSGNISTGTFKLFGYKNS